jgi:protein-L-isoaspartate(D-aspartate) O-methyltransferase
MRSTQRHEFVPADQRRFAYYDMALPIGGRQTISPPFIVAHMTEQIEPQPEDKVLEIGTGSGYQAAVLSPLVDEVYSIEIVDTLGRRARKTLRRLDYENVFTKIGDGYKGWPEHAPFDKIIVTCSPEEIPAPLVEQLNEGGRMIVPVGERYQQNLFRVTKQGGKLHREPLRATLFVPMTGAAEQARQVLPDASSPQVINGSFEEVISRADTDEALPAGWHYLRAVQVVSGDDAPQGQRYLRFTNDEQGRASRALQGLALDGRRVRIVRLSAQVRGRNLQNGPTPQQRPAVLITFYDQRRAAIDNQKLATWQGTFDWQPVTTELRVPAAAREAIVRLGLLGGTGRLEIDELSLRAVP